MREFHVKIHIKFHVKFYGAFKTMSLLVGKQVAYWGSTFVISLIWVDSKLKKRFDGKVRVFGTHLLAQADYV